MNNKRIFFIILLMLLVVPGVSALDSLGTFKLGDTVRIAQVCADATYINISSITYPDSVIAEQNIAMIPSGNGEFYLNYKKTTKLGRYDVRGVSDGCQNTFATYFEITGLGVKTNQIPFQLIFAIFGIALIVLGKSSVGTKLFVSTGSFLLIITGILTLYPGYSGINYSNLLGLTVGFILLGLGFYLFVESELLAVRKQSSNEDTNEDTNDGRYY